MTKQTSIIGGWTALVLAIGPVAAMAQAPGGQPGQAPPPQQQRQAPPQQALPGAERPNVVLTVNGDPITQREVEVNLQRQLQQIQAQQPEGQQLDPQIVQQIQPQVVNGLIESRLVEQYVTEQGPEVPEEEVQASVNQFRQQLESQGHSLDEFLASQGHTKESFQDRIKGSIAWQKYQEEQITEDNLTNYFEQNKERFAADDIAQVKDQVANALANDMWRDIVTQMKPEAEIEQPGAPQRQPERQPQPQLPPAQP